ncbi:hypothetical protein MIMGU_mgv1a025458mg [Erythranthe guttata]|uniref:RBR-type E3 ubiquitin transferase n=1 Tax=Erythranthe guttata TaxID=4155 RepID=A0A022QDI9_ERYGU|nr:hypothetical protein MIMGU_mgv1a025458mg [Erythranthe guttata]
MEVFSYDDDDDYYTSLLLMQYSQIIENNHNRLLSDDDKYAQELQLQETLISSFTGINCSHKFCKDCISKYITMKINRGKSASIACPGPDCEGIMGIEECVGGVVPKEVVTLWDQVICESVIIPLLQRFYCPYKNWKPIECPSCRRLFCVKCKVTWHSGFDCGEFSRMREGERERDQDLMVHALTKKNKWRRCPRCGFFVERSAGCLHWGGPREYWVGG